MLSIFLSFNFLFARQSEFVSICYHRPGQSLTGLYQHLVNQSLLCLLISLHLYFFIHISLFIWFIVVYFAVKKSCYNNWADCICLIGVISALFYISVIE